MKTLVFYNATAIKFPLEPQFASEFTATDSPHHHEAPRAFHGMKNGPGGSGGGEPRDGPTGFPRTGLHMSHDTSLPPASVPSPVQDPCLPQGQSGHMLGGPRFRPISCLYAFSSSPGGKLSITFKPGFHEGDDFPDF